MGLFRGLGCSDGPDYNFADYQEWEQSCVATVTQHAARSAMYATGSYSSSSRSRSVHEMVVFLHREAPIWTPKYGNPVYRDP